jgi:hypothetical protein
VRQETSFTRRSSLVTLVLFAFLLRVGFLFLAGVNAPLTGDELAYQQIAENFAAGRGLYQTDNPFFPEQILYAWQAPLYPLALGVLYSLFGPNILAAKFLSVIVSTATVYVMYDLTRRIFHLIFLNADTRADTSRSTQCALLAALLFAIYPGFLTNAHLLLSETLFIFFLLLAFDFAARAVVVTTLVVSPHAWLWILAAGAMWGLATLTRGITLYFTPLFALWIGWLLWRERQEQGDHAGQGDHKGSPLRAIIIAFLFVLATASVIAPWTLRNYVQFQQIVLLETKGGVNLWLGNSPYTPNDFIRNVWKVGVREPMLNALPSDELQRDRAAYALALNYIRAEPFTFLARFPVKFADFWGFERSTIDTAEATARGGGWNSLAKIGSDLFAMLVYVFVIVCGIIGFVFAPNDRWKLLLGGFTLYYLFAHLVIFGDGRFHLPLIPFFALYAAWFLVMFRRSPFSLPRAALAALVIVSLLVVWAREIIVALQILRG